MNKELQIKIQLTQLQEALREHRGFTDILVRNTKQSNDRIEKDTRRTQKQIRVEQNKTALQDKQHYQEKERILLRSSLKEREANRMAADNAINQSRRKTTAFINDLRKQENALERLRRKERQTTISNTRGDTRAMLSGGGFTGRGQLGQQGYFGQVRQNFGRSQIGNLMLAGAIGGRGGLIGHVLGKDLLSPLAQRGGALGHIGRYGGVYGAAAGMTVGAGMMATGAVHTQMNRYGTNEIRNIGNFMEQYAPNKYVIAQNLGMNPEGTEIDKYMRTLGSSARNLGTGDLNAFYSGARDISGKISSFEGVSGKQSDRLGRQATKRLTEIGSKIALETGTPLESALNITADAYAGFFGTDFASKVKTMKELNDAFDDMQVQMMGVVSATRVGGMEIEDLGRGFSRLGGAVPAAWGIEKTTAFAEALTVTGTTNKENVTTGISTFMKSIQTPERLESVNRVLGEVGGVVGTGGDMITSVSRKSLEKSPQAIIDIMYGLAKKSQKDDNFTRNDAIRTLQEMFESLKLPMRASYVAKSMADPRVFERIMDSISTGRYKEWSAPQWNVAMGKVRGTRELFQQTTGEAVSPFLGHLADVFAGDKPATSVGDLVQGATSRLEKMRGTGEGDINDRQFKTSVKIMGAVANITSKIEQSMEGRDLGDVFGDLVTYSIRFYDALVTLVPAVEMLGKVLMGAMGTVAKWTGNDQLALQIDVQKAASGINPNTMSPKEARRKMKKEVIGRDLEYEAVEGSSFNRTIATRGNAAVDKMKEEYKEELTEINKKMYEMYMEGSSQVTKEVKVKLVLEGDLQTENSNKEMTFMTPA